MNEKVWNTAEIKNNKSYGCYILVLKLNEGKNIQIGKLGKFYFEKGVYFYVGSAKGGFSKRVTRYFKRRKKRWHIDYLLDEAEVIGIFLFDKYIDEEALAEKMSLLYRTPIRKFGATDSKSFSHLFKREGPRGRGAV